MVQGAVPERGRVSSSSTQMRDTRTWRCPTRPEGGDEIIDLPGGDAVYVGLHHHRVQGPVDPPTPVQDRGEEAAMAELRDRQLDVAGLGRQQAWPGAVALVGARVAALVRFGADERGRFGVDERLEHHLDAGADQIDVAAGAQRVEQLGQVKLVEGHRVVLLSVFLGRITQRLTRWPTTKVDPSGLTPLQGARYPAAGPAHPGIRAGRPPSRGAAARLPAARPACGAAPARRPTPSGPVVGARRARPTTPPPGAAR